MNIANMMKMMLSQSRHKRKKKRRMRKKMQMMTKIVLHFGRMLIRTKLDLEASLQIKIYLSFLERKLKLSRFSLTSRNLLSKSMIKNKSSQAIRLLSLRIVLQDIWKMIFCSWARKMSKESKNNILREKLSNSTRESSSKPPSQ